MNLGDGHEAGRRLTGPSADLAPRLVVLDADAAGLDAIALLHRLRVTGATGEVVVATRTADGAEDAVRAGAVATLPKPLVIDDLRAVARATLERRERA